MERGIEYGCPQKKKHGMKLGFSKKELLPVWIYERWPLNGLSKGALFLCQHKTDWSFQNMLIGQSQPVEISKFLLQI